MWKRGPKKRTLSAGAHSLQRVYVDLEVEQSLHQEKGALIMRQVRGKDHDLSIQ